MKTKEDKDINQDVLKITGNNDLEMRNRKTKNMEEKQLDKDKR